MMDKIQFRKQALRQRSALTEAERVQKSGEIASALMRWQPYREAWVRCLYASFGSEVDTAELLTAALAESGAGGRVVCLPRVAGQRLVLHALPVGADTAAGEAEQRLLRSPLGMAEPVASLPVVEPQRVRLVLVPGCAFSLEGQRMGYGKGFYDRLLPQMPQALKVGVGFAAQLYAAADFPTEPHDVLLDYIATEDGIFKASGRPVR